MGRATAVWRRWRRWAAAASLAVLVAGCGGTPAVSLEDLTFNTDEYVGQEVVAHGVVTEFGDEDSEYGRYYVLQDADANRVQLLPPEAAEPHAGSTVEVVGEFDFDPERGRMLHVDTIEPLRGGG